MVETFGRWTPLACRTLKTTALHTTLRNGLLETVAYRNLVEQLSTCLWTFNARIVFRHLSSLPVDFRWGILRYHFTDVFNVVQCIACSKIKNTKILNALYSQNIMKWCKNKHDLCSTQNDYNTLLNVLYTYLKGKSTKSILIKWMCRGLIGPEVHGRFQG